MQITPHDALLVIDMQNDFLLPGAPLEVSGGLDLIPGINRLATLFDHILLTQDWHPPAHISFAGTHGLHAFTDSVQASYGTQALWPDHCVQGTPGAALHTDLDLPTAELILRKGFRRDVDSYSAFFENDRVTPTGLAGFLRERALNRLFFVGLALDFCVGHSATVAARLGFQALVIDDLTRAVDLPATATRPGSVATIAHDLDQAGVIRIASAGLSRA